jgi:AraC family transcriptional regulator
LDGELSLIHTFHGPERSLSVELGSEAVGLSRASAATLGPEVMLYSEPADAVALIYQRDNLPAHDLWLSGRHRRIGDMPRGTMQFVDLAGSGEARLGPRFDSLNIYIPRAALRAIAQANGGRKLETLDVSKDGPIRDPVVASLEPTLVYMIENPAMVDPFVKEMLMATFLTHLAMAYGVLAIPAAMRPGSLAPRQLRRAKDLLAADLGRTISLFELASECGLSPSHFSRAFKASTGVSPFAWLGHLRIECGKALLRSGNAPIAEIALQCGFSDQSHFSRTFARIAGEPPGRWQRRVEKFGTR